MLRYLCPGYMNDAEIFHREMIPHGGRLERNWQPGSPSEQVYGTLANWAGTLISSARELVTGLPPIHFDFVLDGRPNAFAFKADGRYFIGMTTGMRYLLELVFSRMLSDRRLFPFIGKPSEEADSLPVFTGYVPHAQEMYEAGLKPNRPRNDERWFYAQHLLHEAILFLVGHEIAHISRGHVDYLGSKTGHGLIAELGWSNTDQIGLIERQALEMDADHRSVTSRVSSIRQTHETPNLSPPPWATAREPPGLLLFHWVLSMNSLFRLMGDGRFSSADLATRIHPPLPLRRAMASFSTFGCVMETWNAEIGKRTLAALRLAARHTEEAFNIILGENPTLGGMLEAVSPLGREHHKRLIECWVGGLRDRVAPFAYEPDRVESVDST